MMQPTPFIVRLDARITNLYQLRRQTQKKRVCNFASFLRFGGCVFIYWFSFFCLVTGVGFLCGVFFWVQCGFGCLLIVWVGGWRLWLFRLADSLFSGGVWCSFLFFFGCEHHLTSPPNPPSVSRPGLTWCFFCGFLWDGLFGP